MQTLFEYMIKISASYAVIYLFYWLILRRLTNYKSNRFYLIVTALLAFIIPLLRLNLFVSPQTINELNVINYIPSLHINASNIYVPATQSFNVSVILISIFISGVVICLSHFIMQFISFRKITANASVDQHNTEHKVVSFGYGYYAFFIWQSSVYK